MVRWIAVAVLVAASALTGCLLTIGGAASGDNDVLLVSTEIAPADDSRAVALPDSQTHYRRLRFASEAYPVEVYRVILVYRGGAQESFTVSWRFTSGNGYRDLDIPGDRDVREVRMYYRPLDNPPGDRGRSGKGDKGDKGNKGRFSVYGVR